jgi:hypothetical protein
MRHAERAIVVAVHRGLIRPVILPLLIRLAPWAERIPVGPAWWPSWLRLPSLYQIGLVYFAIAAGIMLALFIAKLLSCA